MKKPRLVVPAALLVGTLALAGCTTPCPDPLACESEFFQGPDGGVVVEYRRADGGVSDVPCVPPPQGCPAA